MKHVLTPLALTTALLLSLPARAADIDWKKVDAALGKTAAVSGEVHRYGLPRSDLHVTLDGVAIKPALALGGWVAFAPMHGEAMLMGDLVLLDTEITPVMTKLLDSGLDITAIHNHILRATPATFYMHVAGHGDPEKMASAVHAALSSASKTPFDPPATTATAAPAIDLDTAGIDEAMGAKGTVNGGVYQYGIPRRDPAREGWVPLLTQQLPADKALRERSAQHAAWRCERYQFPTERRRQGCHHRRFPGDRQRGQSLDPGATRRRYRGHRDPQPHARRGAADVLHPFLGQR